MPLPRPLRPVTIAAAIGIFCITLAAFAKPPVSVTFPPGNPWTQEVASVSRSDRSNEYKVAVGANKTLQINLVTRNPNVFFKVRNDTRRKQLTDTYSTGATTWSTKNADAAKYTIDVYVQSGVLGRHEEAKYALQIGSYGKSDMQVPPTAVTFKDNKPWVEAIGKLDSQGTARKYKVSIAAGQTLAVNLITRNPEVHFTVTDQASGQALIDSAKTDATKWSVPVDKAADYMIEVYADPAALPPGSSAGYAVQIGQYPQPVTRPAAAGSTANPTAPAPTATASATASNTNG